MYNRYIRGDSGVYTRIPEEDPQRPNSPPGGGPSPGSGPGRPGAPNGPGHPGGSGGSAGPGAPPNNGPFHSPPPPPKGPDGLSSALRRLLDKFHLDSVDSGDLLLLLLLFFLFKEDADDELLIALGLLLVL